MSMVNKDPSTKIVIYYDGEVVVAKNTKTGKTAKVKCHPYDEFDFNIGAKLEFERLLDSDYLIQFEEGKTYVFDSAIFESRWGRNPYLPWFKECDGKIVEVTDKYSGYIEEFHIAPCWCREIETPKKEVPKFYNGKVVCVETPFSDLFTVGKIYEFKDGYLIYDNGSKNPNAVIDFEDVKVTFVSRFIEVVE